MHKLAALFDGTDSAEAYAKGYCARLAEVMATLDGEVMAKAIEAVDKVCHEGHVLYTIANGGSAGIASHLVNDLVAGGYVENGPNVRAFCLTDNAESVTALSNDAGYENIFLRQLQVHLAPGDVVLAMSASGNSENLIRGIDYARALGAATIGWCGFGGGRLAEACEIVVHLPTTLDEYGPAEDGFAILGHILSGYLSMRHGKRLHH
jgi:D-sedoheptulose 7-phosphate isomerase